MSTKPNVVLFMLDTQRTDNLGCYGYDKPTSPCLDHLADEGAVFLDNVSPAIWTLPAVASVFSGLHCHSHGAGARNDHYRSEAVTLPELMEDAGYYSVAFFGNHFAWMPGRGFRDQAYPHCDANRIGPDNHDVSRARVHDAMKWIERNHLNGDDHPFLMYVQVMDPHMPYFPVSPFKEQFLSDVKDEELDFEYGTTKIFDRHVQLTERQYELLGKMYDAETASGDSHIGVLTEFLRDKGLLDNTIFIVFGDHGEMRGEHSNRGLHDHYAHHLCAYEELIKVPLVVRWPEAFPAGTRVESLSQTHDILPTLAEICGFEAPGAHGFSLLPSVGDTPSRDFTLTEYHKSIHHAARYLDRNPDGDPRWLLRWVKSWRKGPMKYHWLSDGVDELYDVKRDPKERNNLIADKPEVAEAMRLEMERYIATLPCARVPDEIMAGRIKPASVERLRAMEWFVDL